MVGKKMYAVLFATNLEKSNSLGICRVPGFMCGKERKDSDAAVNMA